MPREELNRQIRHLEDEILLLGSMVEEATLKAVDVLKKRDIENARTIFEDDRLINEKRFAIENAILILIATQQPVAYDLRMLAAMLEVISELERMGDYAKGICKITLRLGAADVPVPTREFDKMAELAVSMLHQSLTAFIEENPTQAVSITKQDDAVDELYDHVYHQIVNAMIANPAVIDHANLLMWVAHNLERLADRATNICERTVFIATGELLEMDTSESEDPENSEDF
jgi:phosphate transport system protein